MFILYALCIFYLLVLWLCDNMIGSNRGFFRNPFYFIVNCCKKRSKAKPRIRIPNEKQSEITNGSQKAPPQKLDRYSFELSGKFKQSRFDNGEDYSRDLLMDDYLAENTSKGGIILNKVSKCYTGTCSCTGKKFWALNYVDLDIARGEIFGLLGPNGAGKTTMIQILSGVLEPTKGSLWSWGVNREDDPSRIRNFTNVCPQFDILWAELTVRDHVKLIAWIKGIQDTDIDQFAETLLRNVNLENSLDTKIMFLSGGMRRRVSIALCTIGISPVKLKHQ
jgi:ABC-type lipoprotein export system ATPase subunit